MQPENITALYVGAFVDELARAGVTHVCLCPGSRSAPLALMLADHPAIHVWQHLDERAAAFFALGLAKAQRAPVALLCTSGTAAANFFPAVIEAYYGRVPLIVLTADRPPELRDTGAPQTIDQIKLYGRYAKWFVEMLLPEATPEALRYARTIADRAVAEALAAPAGVVHLNFPFREPLVPLPAVSTFDIAREAGRPYVAISAGTRAPEPAVVAALRADLAGIKRGVIIAGPQNDPAFAPAVSQLARRFGYPLLADPLSQVRCGPHDRRNVIDAYDAFLRAAALMERLAPEVILRFGQMPTSKPALQYLQRYADVRHILVEDAGDWPDALRAASHMVQADPTLFCQALVDSESEPASDWLDTWRDMNCKTRQAIAAQIDAFTEPFEGRVFSELAACLPDGATLFASSSMPVRDLDTFFPGSERRLRFLANRGANGIDGVVSSALGASLGVEGPLVLVLGDLALYHDMNGLLAARLHHLNATLIVIHNDGGGIFSFLPQAAHPKHFEQLFGTPHGLDFRLVAELYGATFSQPATWDEFRERVTASVNGRGLGLIEVRTRRDTNVTMHRQVWKAVADELRKGHG